MDFQTPMECYLSNSAGADLLILSPDPGTAPTHDRPRLLSLRTQRSEVRQSPRPVRSASNASAHAFHPNTPSFCPVSSDPGMNSQLLLYHKVLPMSSVYSVTYVLGLYRHRLTARSISSLSPPQDAVTPRPPHRFCSSQDVATLRLTPIGVKYQYPGVQPPDQM